MVCVVLKVFTRKPNIVRKEIASVPVTKQSHKHQAKKCGGVVVEQVTRHASFTTNRSRKRCHIASLLFFPDVMLSAAKAKVVA